MKFIHAGDLHLRAADAAEQLKTLGAIVQAAVEHKADFLLIAGDLFDADHDADRLRPQARQILEEWGRPTVLLPGNHDARSYGPTADYGEKTLVPQEDLEVFDQLGELPLICLPYRDGRSFADCREQLAKFQEPIVVTCHGTLYLDQWLGWLRDEKEDVGDYFPIFPEDLRDLPIRYLAMGHFHRRFYHTTSPVLACYPGSAYPLTARELGPRSVALVQLEGEKSAQVNAVQLEDVPWYQEISLSALPWREEEMFEELEKALANLEPPARPIVTVRGYAQNERGLRERLEKRLQDLGGPKPRVDLYDYSRLKENNFYRRFAEQLRQERSSDPETEAVSDKALEIITLGFALLEKGRR
jgi:DNA repair exonuclease SbcCD nuclease subunit